ncbi:UNVERIFIED_CONTAM: putative mitochondrial-processing peptidase subunit beta, mitochondrial [Sesamum angustifolium]|uniref:Mitochondrial-processing peptidase subunit beta, mitochondrial n=1 Tax=Sesamum angustifolium TaxID=2727405 RepID=A0AAW2NKE6_9LAMI
MIYDRLAESVKRKLKKLEDPDPRFLKHNSPHPTVDSHTEILSAPLTRVTTLPNGLRIATESTLASQTATVGVFIDAGSREQTTYYAKVMDKDVPRALDILSDILQNSRFDEQRIIRERDVILREMEEYTPLGRTILGPAENIKTIGREHLQKYISTHYTAPRMVVAASGAVKHDDIVEQVKKLFTKLSTNPTTTSQLVAKEPAIFTGSEIRMLDDDIPLAQFAVAFEGASWTDPDSIALMVMQSMLGSWNKNAGGGKHGVFLNLRSELASTNSESMMAFNTNYKDTGLFGVYAVAKPDCLDDLAYAIMYEVTKLCYRVSEGDVIRARNQLKSSLLLHIDGTSPVAEDIGRQLLTYGRRIPYAELFARIDSVDASTVKRVANRFIFDRDVAITATGPIQGLPDYNWFRRRTYWLRY